MDMHLEINSPSNTGNVQPPTDADPPANTGDNLSLIDANPPPPNTGASSSTSSKKADSNAGKRVRQCI